MRHRQIALGGGGALVKIIRARVSHTVTRRELYLLPCLAKPPHRRFQRGERVSPDSSSVELNNMMKIILSIHTTSVLETPTSCARALILQEVLNLTERTQRT